MPHSFNPEIYEVVSKWMDETPISYAPNRKTGKSKDRYEGYMSAKTVGEALALGSSGPDLLHDLQHGLLTVLGGPVREEAIDAEALGTADLKKLTNTDRVVSKWAGFGYRDPDEPRKFVRQNKDGSFFVQGIDFTAMHRLEASTEAKRIMDEAAEQKRNIRECEVLRVLRLWRFNKNDARQNVLPEGQDYVFSDTLGLTRCRDGHWAVKSSSREFPDFTRFLCQWARQQRIPGTGEEFQFSSINVNFDYGARRHRDSNNHGLSMIKALGNFTGGKLGYFPNDDGKISRDSLEELPDHDRAFHDLRRNFALFNGSCAHEVEGFQGERYSLVFFTMSRYWLAPDEVKSFCSDECGINWPSEEGVERFKSLLSVPCGYSGKVARDEAKPGILTWPVSDKELEEAAAEKPKERSKEMQVDGRQLTSSEASRAKAKAKSKGAAHVADSQATPARKRGRASTTLTESNDDRLTPAKGVEDEDEEPPSKRFAQDGAAQGGKSEEPAAALDDFLIKYAMDEMRKSPRLAFTLASMLRQGMLRAPGMV